MPLRTITFLFLTGLVTASGTLPIRNVLILGKTGNGKSTTGNAFAGRELFHAADEMVSVTQTSEKKTWERFGTRYVFVDTPGIFDTERCHEDIFREITDVVYLSPEGFHAIIFQLNPTSRFTSEERNTVEGLVAFAGGREVLDHVILAFSHGDKWPARRILQASKDQKLPKALTSLIEEVGDRVVSIDASSSERLEDSALAMHGMISRVAELHGNRTYSNKYFEEARTRLANITLSFDPEARLRALEEEARQRDEEARSREAEMQRRIKEAEEAASTKAQESEEAASTKAQEITARLLAEMKLEFARREMEAQKERYEDQLRQQKAEAERTLQMERQLAEAKLQMERRLAEEMERRLAEEKRKTRDQQTTQDPCPIQ